VRDSQYQGEPRIDNGPLALRPVNERQNNFAVSSQFSALSGRRSAVGAEFAMILLKADGWKLKATDFFTSSLDPAAKAVPDLMAVT